MVRRSAPVLLLLFAGAVASVLLLGKVAFPGALWPRTSSYPDDDRCAVTAPTGFASYPPAFPKWPDIGGEYTPKDIMTEISVLRKRTRDLRMAYGSMYCERHGIGPSGGFCMPTNSTVARETALNKKRDEGLCTALVELYGKPSTVADFGCGMGQYGERLTALSPGLKYSGFDGSENIENATNGRVTFLDLAEPVWLGKRFDWCMSLEVGEHLPKAFEATFIDNLCRHADKGVVLSWAVPEQGGHHHVNNQPNDYVIGLLQQRGFDYDAGWSSTLRKNVSSLPWFRTTLMVFRRKQQP